MAVVLTDEEILAHNTVEYNSVKSINTVKPPIVVTKFVDNTGSTDGNVDNNNDVDITDELNKDSVDDYKVDRILNKLIPTKLQSDIRFKEFVRSFLVFTNKSINLGDSSFIDLIDINRLHSENITELYINTFLPSIHIDTNNSDSNYLTIKSLIGISTELSSNIATEKAYKILLGLLTYLMGTTNEVDNLIDIINTPSSSKYDIDNATRKLRYHMSVRNGTDIEILEGDEPFKYDIITTASLDFVKKHLIPYIHPAGWVYSLRKLTPYLVGEVDGEILSNISNKTFILTQRNRHAPILGNFDVDTIRTFNLVNDTNDMTKNTVSPLHGITIVDNKVTETKNYRERLEVSSTDPLGKTLSYATIASVDMPTSPRGYMYGISAGGEYNPSLSPLDNDAYYSKLLNIDTTTFNTKVVSTGVKDVSQNTNFIFIST